MLCVLLSPYLRGVGGVKDVVFQIAFTTLSMEIILKKIFSLLIFLLFYFFASQKTFGWSIRDFDVHIELEQSGRMVVEEKITADFSGDPHHGIYRYIPLRNQTRWGHTLRLRTKLLSVTSSQSNDRYWTSFQKGQLYVKIGNPSAYTEGVIFYTLRYSIENAILFIEDHDELYWNVTGNDWAVLMNHVQARITLPQDTGETDLSSTAFLGVYGTRNLYENQDGTAVDIQKENPRTLLYRARRRLVRYEGLTIVLGVPKGILKRPYFLKRMFWFLEDNWPYGIPVLTFLFLWMSWRKRGRDPQGRGTIAVSYEPPKGMTPGEVGTLIDERADLRDVTATLVDLAVRGYLSISEVADDDFVFRKTDKADGLLLKRHEEILLKVLFSEGNERKLSSLQNRLYLHLENIQNAIYEELVRGGYFVASPKTVRGRYKARGYLIAGLGLLFFFIGIYHPQILFLTLPCVPLFIAGLLSGLIFILFARFMPRKTAQGVLALEEIKGLEEYISRAEKEMFQKVDTKSLFEKLLPFAMCLGLTKSWTRVFEHLYTQPPEWFRTAGAGAWNMPYFSQRLLWMNTTTSRTFTSVPRTSSSRGWSGGSGFGGGGFSGGGFGGGGGGGW
ncbi:MAG: DUF2207 domain-containing protein [Chlamydiae bacterium]|nr:DUF2207 domain-containing protein [Chlamydiota bacterium]MBI3265955.1 DUF2207 domain-containing protein [Chlamydiota bacterium]